MRPHSLQKLEFHRHSSFSCSENEFEGFGFLGGGELKGKRFRRSWFFTPCCALILR